jgi:hypothetical protein
MDIATLKDFFMWCSIINVGLITWWALFILFANDFVYRMHRKWFNIPKENFESIHYAGIAFFKIIVFVFNIVPYIALAIISR